MKYIDAEELKRLLDAKYEEFAGKAKTEGYTTLQYQYMADGIDIAEQLIDYLQHEQPDEPVTDCHDLKEAAEEYATTHLRNNEFPTADSAFKAGAEWQKRKMIGEAYEEEVQEVYRDDDGIHCCVSVGTDYKPGTTVYVITIPKEDEDE